MKMKYKLLRSLLSCLVLGSVAFTACNDDEDLGKAPRLFRPIASLSGGTELSPVLRPLISVGVELPIAGADQYLMQLIAVDSVVNSVHYPIDAPVVAEVKTSDLTYKFGVNESISWDTQYTVRIKAVGETLESEYFYCDPIASNDYPTSLKNVQTTELIDVATIVRWGTGAGYTMLDITNSNDSVLQRLDLSVYTADSIIVEKLEPATSYKVKAYVGEVPAHNVGEPFVGKSESDYRGKKVFKTIAAQVYAKSVDLRGLLSADANDTINTAFLAAIEDSTVVVLKGGETYKIEGATFNDKAVKFVTGYSLTGQAKMEVSGNFKLTTNATNRGIEFENIYFYTPNVDVTTTNYGGKYIFNIGSTEVNAIAEKITFKGCSMKFFRGICRIQAAASVKTFTINGCDLKYIAGYGLMNVDNAAAVIENMVLTNSTMSYIDKALVNSKNAAGTKNVTVEYCTFASSPISDAKSYMFDFNTVSPAFTFTKCIFAKTREGGDLTAGNGGSICFRAGSSADFSSSYKTSDLVFLVKTGATEALGAFTGIKEYSGTWTDLFVNPTKFDYTIKDANFGGAKDSGDPRWW